LNFFLPLSFSFDISAHQMSWCQMSAIITDLDRVFFDQIKVFSSALKLNWAKIALLWSLGKSLCNVNLTNQIKGVLVQMNLFYYWLKSTFHLHSPVSHRWKCKIIRVMVHEPSERRIQGCCDITMYTTKKK